MQKMRQDLLAFTLIQRKKKLKSVGRSNEFVDTCFSSGTSCCGRKTEFSHFPVPTERPALARFVTRLGEAFVSYP